MVWVDCSAICPIATLCLWPPNRSLTAGAISQSFAHTAPARGAITLSQGLRATAISCDLPSLSRPNLQIVSLRCCSRNAIWITTVVPRTSSICPHSIFKPFPSPAQLPRTRPSFPNSSHELARIASFTRRSTSTQLDTCTSPGPIRPYWGAVVDDELPSPPQAFIVLFFSSRQLQRFPSTHRLLGPISPEATSSPLRQHHEAWSCRRD